MSEILEVNGKKYIGAPRMRHSCEGCYFYYDVTAECSALFEDNRCSNLNLVWKKMKDNSNLSNVKVGDYIWTIVSGWTAVDDRTGDHIITNNGCDYFSDGTSGNEKYPSAFTKPPKCFNAEPNPCEFKKGDRVRVSNSLGADLETWIKAYFSHATRDYVCVYPEGMTEWSSDGSVERWGFCQKA